MKLLVHFSRIFVGILFIISGFIKLNDPVGFSFKLQEYFGENVLNLEFLIPYALGIALFVVIFEVVLGILLLIGFKSKFTMWSLLLMIIFFTFLTFYSAYFNKVTDCGCFGDAVKLTPWQSFYKDLILLFFILILFFNKHLIKPIFSRTGQNLTVFVSFAACMIFAYYVLNHLPLIDFRPYKIGNNIQAGMTIPENAPKSVYEYKWTFKVNGKEEVIVNKGAYPTIAGEYVSVETTEMEKGYEPPIHDFSIEKDGEDFTEAMLNEPKLVMIVAYNLSKSNQDGLAKLEELNQQAKAKGYKVIAVTASLDNLIAKAKADYHFTFDFYFCDETTLKTIVRSNPGILVLDKGTVKQMVHYNDIKKLKL
ncbi:BT_3928 family protein [Flavobacterium sp. '19STA2R22 D10 B1']|uniref:BT_3928 family protein n=1 Tax=Flavobacterium aerium TaxID=3037261 RepID=UPI00278C7267|nr:BT_3928 family protein [Flavobacterium sp. '19STA2R22 D10 B1']